MDFETTGACRLITDSCCDLPRELLESAGVEVLRFPFMMSDGEHRDDLGVSMSHDEFYRRIVEEGELPSTAQVPMPDIKDALDRAAASGVPTVFLGFSSGLSGTFGTIEMIAETVKSEHPGVELYVVDTLLGSIAQGLLVLEAIAMRDRGASAREIAEWAGGARYRVHGYFILDGFDHLSRGGRLPDVAAVAGAKLDVKPMLGFSTSGKLSPTKVIRGRKKSIRALAEMLEGIDGRAPASIVIASAAAYEDALRLKEHIDASLFEGEITVSSIGPVIGSHVGPGMVAVSFWGADRRVGGIAAAASAARDSAAAATDALRQRMSRTEKDDR